MNTKAKLLGAVFAGSMFASSAGASTINILNPGDTGTTTDGVVFLGEPNPTVPSTGTGVFEPFVRVQHTGTESGFNTDASDPTINFDTKSGTWTHSVQWGHVGTVTYNNRQYYELQLDANEPGSGSSEANRVQITELQIFIAPGLSNPEATGGGINNTGYSGTQYDNGATAGDNALLGHTPMWSLDSTTNGDMTIILQASICDTSGNCGSGKGDMNMYIPVSLLAGAPSDNFVFYSEMIHTADGFEEWRLNTGDQQGGGGQPPPSVPEPFSLGLLGFGLLGVAFAKRRMSLPS
jgi:hypothetical protein